MNRTPLRDITEDEIGAFEQDGVVRLRGVLDMDWVERMRVALDRVLANPGPQGMNLNPEGSPGRFAIDTYIWLFDDDCRALALESPLAQMAARLLRSRKINFLWDFHLVKEPRSPYPTDWHQDQSANPVNGWQVCGSWMPLDKVTLESGAVEYVRGSHRWDRWFAIPRASARGGESYFGPGYDGEIPGEDEPEEYEEIPDFESMRDQYDIIHFDTEPGDVVFQHLLIVHYAPGNFTDRRRRAIAHRWVGDDATYAVRKSKFRLLPPRDPGIKHGDPFPPDHDLYPRVWPL